MQRWASHSWEQPLHGGRAVLRGAELSRARWQSLRANPTPPGCIEKWKTKLNLVAIMTGKLDGRTMSGAKKALGRMRASSNEQANLDAALMANLIKLAESAEKCAPESIKVTPMSELTPHIDKMMQESVEWPDVVQTALVTKRLQAVIAEKNWSLVIKICKPWGMGDEMAFDPKAPCVAACGEQMCHKIQLFNKVVFEKVFIQLIRQGPDTVSEVISLAAHCRDAFADIDLVEAENAVAAALEEWNTIWGCLVALGSDGLRGQHLDSGLKGFDARLRSQTLQDDMLLLSSHMGKTSRTVTALVAAAIEATDFWNSRLQGYVRCAKDVNKLASQYDDVVAVFAALTDDPAEFVPRVQDAIARLGEFKEKLPPAATANLLDTALGTILGKSKVFMAACATPDNVSEKFIQDWQAVLSEAVILYPMAEELNQTMMSLGAKLRDMGLAVKLAELTKQMKEMAKSAAAGQETAWLREFKLTECNAMVNAIRELNVPRDHAIAIAAVGLADNVAEYVAMEIGKTNFDNAKLRELIIAAEGLTTQCGTTIDGVQAKVSMINKTITIDGLLQELAAHGSCMDDRATANNFDLVVSLDRCTKQLHELISASADADHPAAASKMLDDATKFLTELHGAYIKKSKAALEVKLNEIKPLNGGMDNGEYWVDAFRGETWAEFSEHASKTVLKADPNALVDATSGLQQ
ncbi:unnamed protein product, partial [Prorocentrum cordatum]